MYAAQGFLLAKVDQMARRLRKQEGQATVEYVGLVVVVGAGMGAIVGGIGTLDFVSNIGKELVGGLAKGIKKIF